jgi:hypothetical protein
VRVNGQHSSKVLAGCNGKFPEGMRVILDEWKVENEIDLATLFAQFDNSKSSRGAGDIAGAHAKTHADLSEVRNTYVTRLLSGIASYLNNFDGKAMNAEERAILVHDYADFVARYAGMVKVAWLGVVGATGAMFATDIVDREESLRFWNLIRTETHPDPTHPSRVLSAYLRTARSGRASAPSRVVYAKSIHAWNAYRRGETTHLRYFENAPLPKAH